MENEPTYTPEEMKRQSELKMEFLQREYWRVHQKKQDYMRCPYCLSENPIGIDPMCCPLFAKALKAILDRQEEVNRGLGWAQHAQRMLNGFVQ